VPGDTPGPARRSERAAAGAPAGRTPVSQAAPPAKGGSSGAKGAKGAKGARNTRKVAPRTATRKAATNKAATKKATAVGGATGSPPPSKRVARRQARAARRDKGLGRYLPRPDLIGPKVRLGILWFLVAVAAVMWGRWATTALWALMAAAAALQVTRAWADTPRGAEQPGWAPAGAGLCALVIVGAAGVGTATAGMALAVVPLLLLIAHAVAGFKPTAAGSALIGTVMAAIPAVAVVLVVRADWWAGLFLVCAVSFYDAGYFVGGAESSSRLEGPLTGIIGVLAVTFGASAIEASPFDRVTAWMAGGLMALACPLGQMLVSAHLPDGSARVPAMRRLDAYLVAAPLMLAAVWSLG